jgi:hypothetical protein
MCRHSVIPALFSLLGCAMARAIFIAQASGQLDASYSEDNLSLGLQMTWLPVLVACTLLDQNLTNTDLARTQLQCFLDTALDKWLAKQQRPQTPPVTPPTVAPVPNVGLSMSQDVEERTFPSSPRQLPQQQALSPLSLSPPLSPMELLKPMQRPPFVLV